MPAPSRRRATATLGAALGALALTAGFAAWAGQRDAAPGAAAPEARTRLLCDRHAASAEDLTTQLAEATPGQTICLESGDYGSFRGARKPGVVTIRARPGAAVTMKLELDSTLNLRLVGVTIPEAVIQGATRNLTVARSRFTGLAVVHADRMTNANIVFDRNVHADIDTCTSCFQGRLHIDGNSGRPAGILVARSVFSGGNSDGVRADGNGIRIVGNEFFGFDDEDPFHTDPIQIYGGTHIVIRRNHFYDNDVSAQVMMADGGDHNVVEDNVISGAGYTWALTWYSDDSSIIRHNTFADGACSARVRCGIINLGAKPGDPAGRGTIIRDNVMGGISNGDDDDKRSSYRSDHNLTALRTAGVANVTGVPRYVGPRTTWAGHRLAPGSRGRRAASDGRDPGIRSPRRR